MSGQPAVFLLPLLGLAAGLVYWMYRDARCRDHHPWLWVGAAVMVGFLHPLLIFLSPAVYCLSRPKGILNPCPLCRRPYLAGAVAICPWCRQAVLKDCPRCHEAVSVDEAACPRCGATFS
ncbi:MAG TPA: zinc ribbon domain-containing protein [Limnochordia bacterium]